MVGFVIPSFYISTKNIDFSKTTSCFSGLISVLSVEIGGKCFTESKKNIFVAVKAMILRGQVKKKENLKNEANQKDFNCQQG
jgi:hypothetical protein